MGGGVARAGLLVEGDLGGPGPRDTLDLMRPFSAVLAIAGVLLLTGCRGKIVSTAELHGPGSAAAHFTSTGAPLVLWADTDGKWHGSSHARFAAHYEIDVLGGTTKVGHISCDTKDSSESVCGVEVSDGDTHHGDCELKLTCELPAIPAGAATLHVTGSLGAGTSEVKKMSVNVRDK